MSKEELSKKVLQSYIYSESGNFFISTCYRRSSAMLNPDGWYYETLVWELNDKNERGKIVDENSAMSLKEAIKKHYNYCENKLIPLNRDK